MKPTFFTTPVDFRGWLERNHDTATELWVGFHKTSSGRPSLTWPESVDEALCFGWIDGVRKSLGAESYVIRFTPRTRASTWSLVNIRRAGELVRAGRMHPAGVRAFEARDPKRSGIYSFEQRAAARLTREELARFRTDRDAFRFFESQPPGYRRTAVFWVTSAKREATRTRRLETLIEDSRAGKRIGPLRRN